MTFDEAIAALTIWREARGESFEAKVGVACVILNRANDQKKRWPRTLVKVSTQSGVNKATQRRVFQFSCYGPADPNHFQFPDETEAAFIECVKALAEARERRANGTDPTKGANCYHSPLPADKIPAWANPADQTAAIGAFKFFRL